MDVCFFGETIWTNLWSKHRVYKATPDFKGMLRKHYMGVSQNRGTGYPRMDVYNDGQPYFGDISIVGMPLFLEAPSAPTRTYIFMNTSDLNDLV